MPRIQLLGHIDIDTREWSDGVLTAASRAVVKEPLGKKSIRLFFVNNNSLL
jgi:dynein heavy chain 2